MPEIKFRILPGSSFLPISDTWLIISAFYSYFKAYIGFFPDTLRIWNKTVKRDTERSIKAAKPISHHDTVV